MAKGRSIFEQAIVEIKRLERLARRVEKRGYSFKLPFRFTKTGAEKKRYTKEELNQLKKLRTKDLYKYSTAYGMSGEEYLKRERSESAKRAAETRRLRRELQKAQQEAEYDYYSIDETIIENFLSPSEWRNSAREPQIIELAREYINRRIAEFEPDGKRKVAFALEKAKASGVYQEIQRSYVSTLAQNFTKLEQYFKLYDSTYYNLTQYYNSTEDDFETREESEDFEERFG